MEDIHVPVVGQVSGLVMATAVNEGFDSLQANIGGVLTKSVAGGADVVLTDAEAQNGIINLSGALTANISVKVPQDEMRWTVTNGTSGTFSLTFKANGGTGITIPQGQTVQLYCDGTNVLRASSSDVAMQNQTYTAFTTGGTAPAFTITTGYGPRQAKQRMSIQFHAAAVAATLNRDGLGAVNLKQYAADGTKVAAVITANLIADVLDDGTDFIVIDALPAASGSGGGVGSSIYLATKFGAL